MADDLFTKALYSSIFSAGIEVARRGVGDECLRFEPAKAMGDTTGEDMLDRGIREQCGTNQFIILAAFDVKLTKERRLFVCRVQYGDTTGSVHINTFTAWIEPNDSENQSNDDHGDTGGMNIVEAHLTREEEDRLRKLLDF